MTLKDTSPALTLILGIILGAIFVMLALGVDVTEDGNFNFSLTTTNAPPGSSSTTYETTYVTEGGETTTVQRADLRQVSLPYLMAFPNSSGICVAAGGIWHESRDWVGCEGAGPLDCNTAEALAARTQCIGVGADFMCSTTNVYCRYP